MALSGSWNRVSFPGTYWSAPGNTLTQYWSGNWSKSGNTITLSGMTLFWTFAQPSSGTASTTVTVSAGGRSSVSSVTFSAANYASSIAALNNLAFTVAADASSANITINVQGEGSTTITIYFDPTQIDAKIVDVTGTLTDTNFSPVVTFTLADPGSTDLVLEVPSGNDATEIARWKNLTSSPYSPALSDEEMANLLSASSTSNTQKIRFVIVTVRDDEDVARSPIEKTFTIADADPIFTDFSYQDTNTATVEITGNNQVFIAGVSTPRVTVPVADRAQGVKGATMISYRATIGTQTKTLPYSDTDDVIFTDWASVNSGEISVQAIDSRGNSTTVARIAEVIPYLVPTLTVSGARESGFSSTVNVSILGTYSPIVVDGDAKNTLSLRYRTRQADSPAWSDWQAVAVTTNEGAFGAEFELTLSNESGWDIEVEAADLLSPPVVEPIAINPAFAAYKVNLYIDDVLIGDIRSLAQNLTYTRRRTIAGVDSISFTINDRLADQWATRNGTTLQNLLRPLALTCRIVRNGVEVVGGFLATMPSYQPNNASANLALNFDGYLNLLEGVYLAPAVYENIPMANLVVSWVREADSRAANAGKAFGFVSDYLSSLESVTQTFDDYKTVKAAICDRADNVSGAGIFDVYFAADKSYSVVGNSDFGVERGYTINYPGQINGITAATIAADEVQGFASSVLGLGSGETSADPTLSTVITNQQTNSSAVVTYGYAESLLQSSSISQLDSLQENVATRLAELSNIESLPKITLSGRQVAPTPEGDASIWLGDIIALNNSVDPTGVMSGKFRVQELQVAIAATDAEIITPTLERVADGFTLSGNWSA